MTTEFTQDQLMTTEALNLLAKHLAEWRETVQSSSTTRYRLSGPYTYDVDSWIVFAVKEALAKADDRQVDLNNMTSAYRSVVDQLESAHSAKRTLERLGYTDGGGSLWRPPQGKPLWEDFTRYSVHQALSPNHIAGFAPAPDGQWVSYTQAIAVAEMYRKSWENLGKRLKDTEEQLEHVKGLSRWNDKDLGPSALQRLSPVAAIWADGGPAGMVDDSQGRYTSYGTAAAKILYRDEQLALAAEQGAKWVVEIQELREALSEQKAEVERLAEKTPVIPEGWIFYRSDFSAMAKGCKEYGSVELMRDYSGQMAWDKLSIEQKNWVPCIVKGYGKTVLDAMVSAASVARETSLPAPT